MKEEGLVMLDVDAQVVSLSAACSFSSLLSDTSPMTLSPPYSFFNLALLKKIKIKIYVHSCTVALFLTPFFLISKLGNSPSLPVLVILVPGKRKAMREQ